MDRQRFLQVCEKVVNYKRESTGIGTLSEKTLHAVVKHYIELDENKQEVKIGSFYADIVTEDGIFEIHTRSFNTLRKKLTEFLEISTVTVVYPLPGIKWLLWIDGKTGEVTKKRKSPKQGCIYDAIHELYKIRPLIKHPNFRLYIIFIDIEEYRNLDGWSENKKKGSSRYDRIPVDIAGEAYFGEIEDYLQFVPYELDTHFTSKDYKKAAKINMHTAQTALNILHHIGTLRRVGKKGNLHIYERNV